MSCSPSNSSSCNPLVSGYPYKTAQNTMDYKDMAPVDYMMGKNVVGSYDGIYQPYVRPDLKERAKILGINTSSQYYDKVNKNHRYTVSKEESLDKQYSIYYKGKISFVPQGTPLPLKTRRDFIKHYQRISMFLFAKNRSSPDCCPSSYSSDQGCVCVTPQQVALVAKYRGGNKTHYDNMF